MIKRNTKQKMIIINAIGSFETFFSAKDLHEAVKDKKIGIATVYRILKELSDEKRLFSYICDRRIIYSRNHNSHCHFRCEKCSKIEHVDISRINFIKEKIGGDVCHFHIDMYGICKECKEKE